MEDKVAVLISQNEKYEVQIKSLLSIDGGINFGQVKKEIDKCKNMNINILEIDIKNKISGIISKLDDPQSIHNIIEELTSELKQSFQEITDINADKNKDTINKCKYNGCDGLGNARPGKATHSSIKYCPRYAMENLELLKKEATQPKKELVKQKVIKARNFITSMEALFEVGNLFAENILSKLLIT